MKSTRLGYIVVALRPASGVPEDSIPSQLLHPEIGGAEFERDMHEDAVGPGSRFIVAEVFRVEAR